MFSVVFNVYIDLLGQLQTKKQYEKSFRESEKAQEAYSKADADIHMSRADVEKVCESIFLLLCDI